MVQEETTTQKLQNKVDKLKLLNLTSNIHNLTPPQLRDDNPSRDIALVNVLSVHPRIISLFLETRGLEYDSKTKTYVQITKPIMNFAGAYKLVQVLKHIAQETEWPSFGEEEIHKRIIHYYEENLPYFLFYNEEYELEPINFNFVETVLKSFIDSSFHKSKHGKYINTLGRTYGEDVLKRALDTSSDTRTKKDEGFLSKYNPFKERSWA